MARSSLNLYWREIVSIIEGGLKPDPHRVESFARHMAQRLEENGEERLARRIRRLTDDSSKPSGSTFVAQGFPADLESHQPLIDSYLPNGAPQYPILSSSTDAELRRFVELIRRSGELERAGIDQPSSMILYGPPGCGKTMAATAIACDLGLPLFLVRLDTLVGSFLGNSAKNLRRVFDNALARPCVLFIDEFDVVGKMRDDTQEVGEIKRLVGSLLQSLDRTRNSLILIAATNHHHVLDDAIWRRFDVSVQIEKPNESQLLEIVRALLPEQELSMNELKAISAVAEGLSGSAMTAAVKRALQDAFLYPREPLRKLLTVGILAQLQGHDEPHFYMQNRRELLLALNQRLQGNISVRQLANLAGCSHTYASDVVKNVKEGL